jgi:hypothetical protein
MRSRWWYVVAGVIALAGLVAAALYVLPRIGAVDRGTLRAVMPGSVMLILDTPGTYTIFHERRSVVDGRYYASESADGLKVTLADPRGAPVALVEPAMSSSYHIGNREGQSILAFDITEPGRYRLSASLANGAAEPKMVLAVSQGLIGGLFRLVFTTLGIAFAGFGLAGLLVAVVAWRRSKAVAKPAAGR